MRLGFAKRVQVGGVKVDKTVLLVLNVLWVGKECVMAVVWFVALGNTNVTMVPLLVCPVYQGRTKIKMVPPRVKTVAPDNIKCWPAMKPVSIVKLANT